MSVESYVVYEDDQGSVGAVLDTHGSISDIDMWIEGRKVLGRPAANNERSAIEYVEIMLGR